ncbi:hypothetical protein WS68_23170 [Burkholderia sp. TSV86]|nr:hypothetical protein WS68_23170 [Burkholderia sp. TSV86]
MTRTPAYDARDPFASTDTLTSHNHDGAATRNNMRVIHDDRSDTVTIAGAGGQLAAGKAAAVRL